MGARAITRQSSETFRRISFLGFHVRAVRTWKFGALFSCVWVLHVEHRKLAGDSVVIRAHCLARQWIHVLHQ